MTLTEIILKLRPALEKLPYIHAMWVEGSYATGLFRIDSDIDVWLDVDKEAFSNAYNEFVSAVEALGELRSEEELVNYSQEPYLAKTKLYLKDKTDEQRIELDLQAHGRSFVFSRSNNPVITIFDKTDVIKWKP